MNVTSRSISLTWNPPTPANQNGIIRSYIINMTVLETQETIQFISNSAERNFEMLHPYYTYSFALSAVTTGPGPPSSAYNVTTDEEGNLTNSFGKNEHACVQFTHTPIEHSEHTEPLDVITIPCT